MVDPDWRVPPVSARLQGLSWDLTTTRYEENNVIYPRFAHRTTEVDMLKPQHILMRSTARDPPECFALEANLAGPSTAVRDKLGVSLEGVEYRRSKIRTTTTLSQDNVFKRTLHSCRIKRSKPLPGG